LCIFFWDISYPYICFSELKSTEDAPALKLFLSGATTFLRTFLSLHNLACFGYPCSFVSFSLYMIKVLIYFLKNKKIIKYTKFLNYKKIYKKERSGETHSPFITPKNVKI